jgi:hypothetical protein
MTDIDVPVAWSHIGNLDRRLSPYSVTGKGHEYRSMPSLKESITEVRSNMVRRGGVTRRIAYVRSRVGSSLFPHKSDLLSARSELSTRNRSNHQQTTRRLE